MKKILIGLVLMLPIISHAEITPEKGKYDPRVRVVDYNQAEVVKIVTFYGVSTHIQFADDETIKDVALGDEGAWSVTSRVKNLYIKPKALNADTNLTVATDKHIYQFALIVQPKPVKDSKAWANPNLIFSLSFRFPADEAKNRAIWNANNAREINKTSSQNTIKTKLAEATKNISNNDYWIAGSEEISPTGARDDGRFIYLTFSNNRDMPAVFSVDADGTESLINSNVIEGNTIVVQRMVKNLMLRKGNFVASVINKSFDWSAGTDNTTGTIAPDVIRVNKGGDL
jgi:type IV secretion system protein VirB9